MATDVSNVVSHFPSAENGFTTTLSGSISAGAATVGLSSVAGYANGEVAVFVVDPTNATKKQTFTGTIDTAGVQVTNVIWTAGTNQGHDAGATVVDYASATHISMISKGLLVQHKQDGTHANTITTNTINENTAANGVTIDGLNIKDNKLNTNNSVVTANITDSAVTTAKVNDDAITAQKLVYGIVRNRQGSTTGDNSWETRGTNNTDTSAKDVFIQVGSVATSSGGDTTITFPTAFNQVPLVLATTSEASGNNSYAIIISRSTTQAVIRTVTDAGAASTQGVNWMAIGQ